MFLRLNLPRENDWIEATGIEFSTLVISSNVLETFFSTSIKTINNRAKPYIIDPLTYIYGLESIDLSPKRWYSKLVSHYGLDLILSPGVTTLTVGHLLTAGHATNSLRNLVENVTNYQKRRILDSSEFDDFTDIEGFQGHDVSPDLFVPRFLIPPYFYMGYDVEDISDIGQSQWLKVNIECARHAVARKETSEKICAVILISKSLLFFPEQIEKLVNEYGTTGVDAFMLWMPDFREYREPLQLLGGFVKLVSTLSKLGKPVFNFYGGMFSLLLSKGGIAGVCHSPCYGESKDPFAEPGMLATVRYYDQDMKIKVPYGKLVEFLKLTNRDYCGCQYCVSLRGVVGDTTAARGKRIELAAKHFLMQRSSEILSINAGDAQAIVSSFTQTFELCEQNDPNGTYADYYKHLKVWNSVLSKA